MCDGLVNRAKCKREASYWQKASVFYPLQLATKYTFCCDHPIISFTWNMKRTNDDRISYPS